MLKSIIVAEIEEKNHYFLIYSLLGIVTIMPLWNTAEKNAYTVIRCGNNSQILWEFGNHCMWGRGKDSNTIVPPPGTKVVVLFF